MENAYDHFKVVGLLKSEKVEDFDIEYHILYQTVKGMNYSGPAYGIDFIYNGEIFYSNICFYPTGPVNINYVKERFECHFKKQLNVSP